MNNTDDDRGSLFRIIRGLLYLQYPIAQLFTIFQNSWITTLGNSLINNIREFLDSQPVRSFLNQLCIIVSQSLLSVEALLTRRSDPDASRRTKEERLRR